MMRNESRTATYINDTGVDELIERQLLRLLAHLPVLPAGALAQRLASVADRRAVRRVLDELVARGLVVKSMHRQGIWYAGYALRRAEHDARLADMPAAMAHFLGGLAW
jgi:hypothetical protein